MARQPVAVRLNAAALAVGALHVGVDVGVARHWSTEGSILYRPFESLETSGASVGVRWWYYEPHAGWFVGTHVAAVQYNAALSHASRTRGWAAGLGVSTGYSLVLSKRWNFSVEAGLGLFFSQDIRWQPNPAPLETVRFTQSNRLSLVPSRFELSFSYLF